jgi:multidrug resistance efflux pump
MLIILIGFLIIAFLQWFIIKRIPWRILRLLIQVPLLAITVIVALFLLGLQQVENEQVAAEAVQESILDSGIVSRGDLVVSVSGTASIIPARQVALNFSLGSAPVTLINIQLGDTVVAGHVLAELDNIELAQALEDAELALEIQMNNFESLTAPARPEDIAVAQAALDSANAQVNSAVSTGASAEEREIAELNAEIARNQLWQIQLNRDNVVDNPPPETVNGRRLPPYVIAENQANYEGQSRQAEANVEQAEYGVDIADANNSSTQQDYADPGQLASANAALVRAEVAYNQLVNGPSELQIQQAARDVDVAELNVEQARINLEASQIIAPFDGLVAELNLTLGELPPQGTSILLMDASAYYVELPIDETEIAHIAIGQVVNFDVDALPDSEVTGTVSSIAYAPIQSQEANLVAYNVQIAVHVGDAPIRAGMTVTGNIITLERQDVLLLRNNFIRIDRRTGDAFVTVRHEDNSLEERLILLGESNELFSIVTAGLTEGEEVVLLPREESLVGD